MSRVRVFGLMVVAGSLSLASCGAPSYPDPQGEAGGGVAGQAGAGATAGTAAAGGVAGTGSANAGAGAEASDAGAGAEPMGCDPGTGMALAFKSDVIDLVAGDLGPALPGGNAPRTVELWAYFTGELSWTPNHSIIELGRRVDLDNQVFGFDLAGHDGTLGSFAPYTNNLGDNDPTPVAMAAQGWHHLAWGYDGAGRFQLVIDGVSVPLANPGDGTGMLATTPGFILLGGSQNFGWEGWEGVMDEIRLWNVLRSETEIARDMRVKLRGTEPGLVAYYALDKGRGVTVDDVLDQPGYKLTLCPGDGGPCPVAAASAPTWVESDIPGPFTCAE